MTVPQDSSWCSTCAAEEIPSLDPTGQQDWLRIVGGLRERPGFFWLDSASHAARNGRYSFAGAEPWAETRVRGARIERVVHRDFGLRPGDLGLRPGDFGLPGGEADGGGGFGDALDAVRALMPPRPNGGAPIPVPFVGGAVGFLGYEAGDAWETLPAAGIGIPELPDATWLGVDRVYAIDHLEGRIWAIALGIGAAERSAATAAARGLREMVVSLPAGAPPPGWPGAGTAATGCARGFDAETHGKAVGQIRERIEAGDVYQACLTHKFELPFSADPWALYGALRAHNPAPFAAYLELSDLTWVGSSPERFLSATPQGWLESRPIKGTRPRGENADEDRQLRAALEGSAKDRAENLMIVDLVRNDLGRVAELGSVHVPELFHIEPHPTVFQLVSTVRARLAERADVFDAVRAAFPPGSMTGAPKLAAMEILRELEPNRRGAYAGALGYFDARGGADLSVVIRTAFIREGRAWLHAGGGIVHDSDPAEEWDEAETKARALLEAIAAVESAGAR